MRVREIIKLGGSVVTDKTRDRTPDIPAIRAIGGALADHPCPRVMVHGTGSYGKPFALRYGYLDGHFEAHHVDRYLEIRAVLQELARTVARALAKSGLPVAELGAYECFVRDTGGRLAFVDPGHVGLLVDRGAIPLLQGDLFVCPRDGYRVVSSDQMVLEMARFWHPERVLFLSDVEGVRDPQTGALVTDVDHVWLGGFRGHESDTQDVSGGMSAKLRWAREAARHADECWILDGRDEANLRAALGGRPFRGSRVHPAVADRATLERPA